MSRSTADARAHEPHGEASVWARRSVLVGSAVLFALGTFGSNIGPAWVDERPAVVLALSSRNRNLFGSVPFIDALPYFLIGFGRIFAAGAVLFFLGRWYGRRAIDWTEGQVGEMPAIYRWFQTAVDRAGWAIVLFMPGSNLVCLMAGHRRMAPARFLSFLAVGIVVKLLVLWWGGQVFEDQIRSFLVWIEDYQWWIVAALFGLSFVQSAGRVRRSAPEVLEEIEHPDIGHTESASADTAHTDTAHTDTAHTDTAHTDTEHPDTEHPGSAHTEPAPPDRGHGDSGHRHTGTAAPPARPSP